MSRRSLVGAAAMVLGSTPASASPLREGVYRRSVVIDGNAVADPLYRTRVIDPITASRLRASGLTVLKQTLGDTGAGFAEAGADLERTKAAISRNGDLFSLIETPREIARAKRGSRIGVILSFESATMLEGRVESIDHFAREGVRVMGLSYNAGSPFGGGALQPGSFGLTELGREAVARMVELGVSVDLSHSNEATSFQALASSRTPMLITHGGSAAVHANPRNKSDPLLKAVAQSGGVVGVYTLSFLGGYPAQPTLELYMRHLLHALDVCGEDHVGIGSDSFLTGSDTSPAAVSEAAKHEAERRAAGVAAPEELGLQFTEGLNGPDRYEVICTQLLRRGVKARAVEKVLGANFERVFAQTWSPSRR